MTPLRCPRCTAPAQPADQFCSQCGQPLAAAGATGGQLVDGRFRVIERLGAGGMAEVFLAEQTTVRRSVALKLLRPEYADATHHERFRREALAASRLNHPNTVTIYDFGRADRRLYIAMEYVPGQTLHRVLRSGPLEWTRAVTIARQICGSLHNAHTAGVVHRDLKSENIMLFERGPSASGGGPDQVKVLDFGIAKLLEPDEAQAHLSTPNLVLGTPAVMAPELLLGQPVSPRSDIYSLGVVLYQMLAGRLPFDARDVAEIIRGQLYAEPPPFDQVAPDAHVPPDLTALVREMLAKQPDARPESMEAVADRLATLGDQRPDTGPWTTVGIIGAQPTLPLTPISAAAGAPAVRRLVERLQKAPDFPAFAGNVSAVNAACSDPDLTAAQLADTVLRDYGVTEKLLRLANSAFYRRHNQETTRVSRAVVMLGFEQVRRIALSLAWWSHVKDAGRRAELAGAALRSLSGAVVARGLAADIDGVEPEEAFVCAMFHTFGRQLVTLHLPEEADRIKQAIAEGKTEHQAALEVLGAPLSEVGATVAQQLSFPARVAETMRPPTPADEQAPADAAAKLRVLTTFSNAVAEALDTPAPREDRLRALARRYGPALALDADRLDDVLRDARDQLTEYAGHVEADLGSSALLDALAFRAARAQAEPPERLRLYHQQVQAAARAGAALDDVVALVLEALTDAGVTRALFALKNFKTGRMSGRLGSGDGAGALLKRFHFEVDGRPDLFRLALARGQDLVVEDARLPSIRGRLPTWYLELANPVSLAVYPVMVRGVAVALLYADGNRERPTWLGAEAQAVFRALRDQVVVAFEELGRRRRAGRS